MMVAYPSREYSIKKNVRDGKSRKNPWPVSLGLKIRSGKEKVVFETLDRTLRQAYTNASTSRPLSPKHRRSESDADIRRGCVNRIVSDSGIVPGFGVPTSSSGCCS